MLRRLLPHPLLSIGILLLWLVLARAYTLNSLLFGLLLGVALPLLTAAFLTDLPRVHKPLKALLFFLIVCRDIIVANWEVALLVLGPLHRIEPRFVTVPLSTSDPFIATLVGSVVSLTPGTVTVDIDMEQRLMLVHGLRITDAAGTIAGIKARYEAPLMEIFGC